MLGTLHILLCLLLTVITTYVLISPRWLIIFEQIIQNKALPRFAVTQYNDSVDCIPNYLYPKTEIKKNTVYQKKW